MWLKCRRGVVKVLALVSVVEARRILEEEAEIQRKQMVGSAELVKIPKMLPQVPQKEDLAGHGRI